MSDHVLHLIGYASGIAGVYPSCGEGPVVLQTSSLWPSLLAKGLHVTWDGLLKPNLQLMTKEKIVRALNEQLALTVLNVLKKKQPFLVIGGDHTCAIGTWSGVYDVVHEQGDLGLIWIDAHMDSHTPQTTMTGRIHGMPLACLLGRGDYQLTTILHAQAKLKPENLILIGVRSFEKGEADLLRDLNVRIYYMPEVKKRGLTAILEEARQTLHSRTLAYGVSLDLDSIDPLEAPGVDVPEPNGLHIQDLLTGWTTLMRDPKCIGAEIVEFDPIHDKNQMTEKILLLLIDRFAEAKNLYLEQTNLDKNNDSFRS